ncbi:MAG: endonuclease [Bacteroidetes bacterium]|nr:endonuclease [Bacteroidota bacterium]
MRKFYSALLGLLLSLQLLGSIPPGYYDPAAGLSNAALKTALYNIIKDHTVKSYDYLWTAFQTTDKKSNGKVWDMYSDIPNGTPPYEFTFVTNQCGTYNSEGDCYNREHSWPSSWFNDASPMYTDLFHLIPADGYVNNRRGNYPFGTVSNPTWTSLNGSKVGSCSAAGYSGVVFEPRDEYKGDFARAYFYMATRYENVISTWHSNDANAEAVLQANSYPVFEPWFLNLLGAWNIADPVSQKEIARNDAVYAIQNNRNPFIDHPEYVYAIWGVGAPLPTPTITGPASVCAGTSGNVYTTESGQTNYVWTVSSGGTVVSGGTSSNNTITVTWTTSGARTVSVNYTNSSGLTALSPTIYNVTVNSLPVPALTGPSSVTVGSSGNVYTTQSAMTNYSWGIPAGGTVTSGGTSSSNTATITWNTIGSKVITINYTNSNSCTSTTPSSYTVTVNLQPEPTNFPSDFSAHNILLQWVDATGGVLPTAYLIRMNASGFNEIQNPVDGIPVPDGLTDKNIAYGIQQAIFSVLTPNTTYYFKIFGYTGSGSNISYKTNGIVPQIQMSTSP